MTLDDAKALDVAMWMKRELQRSGQLTQEFAAAEIKECFGEER